MKRLIYSMVTTALLAGIATIGFTPAQAINAPDRKSYVGSSVTPVHCQKNITATGEVRAQIEANTATSAASSYVDWR